MTAVLTLRFNLQKYAVILASSVLGAAAIVGTILMILNPIDPTTFADHPAKVVIDQGAGWAILLVVAAAGAFAFQFSTTRHYEVTSYNRWTEYTTPTPGTEPM